MIFGKMKFKRVLSVMLTTAFIVGSCVSVYAAEDDITVNGTVKPLSSEGQIQVVIPTKATFTIDGQRQFISPNYTIVNNSADAKIKVTAKSLVADTANTCKVVASTAHTDAEWEALTHDQTISQIALGLVTNGTTKWFDAEDTESNIVLGQADAVGGELVAQLAGKYGHAWDNSTDLSLKYKMILVLDKVD